MKSWTQPNQRQLGFARGNPFRRLALLPPPLLLPLLLFNPIIDAEENQRSLLDSSAPAVDSQKFLITGCSNRRASGDRDGTATFATRLAASLAFPRKTRAKSRRVPARLVFVCPSPGFSLCLERHEGFFCSKAHNTCCDHAVKQKGPRTPPNSVVFRGCGDFICFCCCSGGRRRRRWSVCGL